MLSALIGYRWPIAGYKYYGYPAGTFLILSFSKAFNFKFCNTFQQV